MLTVHENVIDSVFVELRFIKDIVSLNLYEPIALAYGKQSGVREVLSHVYVAFSLSFISFAKLCKSSGFLK